MAFRKDIASNATLQLANPRGGTAASNAAQLIAPAPTTVATANIPTIGNVSPIQNYQGQIPYSSIFTVELANASSGNVRYVIGDSTGICSAELGGTIAQPTGASIAVPALQQLFSFKPITVMGFNIETSSNAAQFSQQMFTFSAGIMGQSVKTPIILSAGQRNSQFNDLLLTIALPQPLLFDPTTALFVDVLAGQTVNFTFFVFVAAGS